jgi:hypothetical protein
MYPLINIFLRILLGERLRKATPAEKRNYAGFFFFAGIGFTIFSVLQHCHSPILQFFDSAGAFAMWFFAVVTISIGVFGCFAWSKYVPPKISVALAIAAWAILLFLLFGLGYWDGGIP